MVKVIVDIMNVVSNIDCKLEFCWEHSVLFLLFYLLEIDSDYLSSALVGILVLYLCIE